jgi:hypothetical protein
MNKVEPFAGFAPSVTRRQHPRDSRGRQRQDREQARERQQDPRRVRDHGMDRQEGQASRSTKGGRRRHGFAKPSASVPWDFYGSAVFLREPLFGDGFRASLTALPAWNRTALLAAMAMVSPVRGFRPW